MRSKWNSKCMKECTDYSIYFSYLKEIPFPHVTGMWALYCFCLSIPAGGKRRIWALNTFPAIHWNKGITKTGVTTRKEYSLRYTFQERIQRIILTKQVASLSISNQRSGIFPTRTHMKATENPCCGKLVCFLIKLFSQLVVLKMSVLL